MQRGFLYRQAASGPETLWSWGSAERALCEAGSVDWPASGDGGSLPAGASARDEGRATVAHRGLRQT